MDIMLGGAGAYLDISGTWGLPIWLWIILLFGGLAIAPFLAFHKVRVQRDKALETEKSLIITPHTWAIGLSGMTGFPKEPENADWLWFGVNVNPINRPIDKLDLLIGNEQPVPADHCPRGIVASLNVYFNVTKWRWMGKHQAELIAYIGGKQYSSGRIEIDFNVEPFGKHLI